MNNLKKVFAIMAIVFVGIIALPYTASLFAGQHCWYDLVAEGNRVPCVKCHADIADELQAGGHHKTLSSDNINEACEACHRGNSTITDASGDGNSALPGKEAHAASAIHCGYCHFNSSNPTGAPVAGGFGQSDLPTDTGANASHYSFVVRSRASNLLPNASDSCVACHTTLNVIINFNVTTEATIIANNTYTTSQSDWDIEDITPSNYTTYEEEKEV
jgi:hypothetical protein